MILTPTRSRTFLQPQLHRQQFPEQLQIPHYQLEQLALVPRHRQRPALANSSAAATVPATALCGDTTALDLDLDLDFVADLGSQSLSSSPLSTQSLLSQTSSPQYASLQHSPLSAFDPLPVLASADNQLPLFGLPQGGAHAGVPDPAATLFGTDPRHDAWIPSPSSSSRSMLQAAARAPSHHRDSSFSSLASAVGPASPYSHNTANPQIAVTDSMGDFFAASTTDDFHPFAATKAFPSADSYYANFPAYNAAATADASALAAAYPNVAPAPKPMANRGLQIPPAVKHQAARKPRPLSVASSVASDSPATPAGEPEGDTRHPRHDAGLAMVPKLDRTMTDVYGDELYSPNFSMAPSAASGPVPVSPNHDIFSQRLQAANSQLLTASQSPVSIISRGMSPFKTGSPLASAPANDFSTAQDHSQSCWHEPRAAHQPGSIVADARSQHTGSSINSEGPETISPKDALLDYHEPEGEANFPLFPSGEAGGFDAEQISKAAAAVRDQQLLESLAESLPEGIVMDMDHVSFHDFLDGQLPLGIQLPQQYPFIAQPQQQEEDTGGVQEASSSSPSPSSTTSADVAASDSSAGGSPQRPASTSAEGGTYTCTYHGCTQRFETPALLQKHKREGHRQAHTTPGGGRRPDGSATSMTASLFNSQAGPHRCDRINPSTGKPCAQIFSRPYDLTRHEDTIHNARKQKVRCDLCSEEKTFSRADALTRHYRVCHPGHEPQGKHRKRAGQSG